MLWFKLFHISERVSNQAMRQMFTCVFIVLLFPTRYFGVSLYLSAGVLSLIFSSLVLTSGGNPSTGLTRVFRQGLRFCRNFRAEWPCPFQRDFTSRRHLGRSLPVWLNRHMAAAGLGTGDGEVSVDTGLGTRVGEGRPMAVTGLVTGEREVAQDSGEICGADGVGGGVTEFSEGLGVQGTICSSHKLRVSTDRSSSSVSSNVWTVAGEDLRSSTSCARRCFEISTLSARLILAELTFTSSPLVAADVVRLTRGSSGGKPVLARVAICKMRKQNNLMSKHYHCHYQNDDDMAPGDNRNLSSMILTHLIFWIALHFVNQLGTLKGCWSCLKYKELLG